MKQIVIEPNFKSWQAAAREALRDELPPTEIIWVERGAEGLALFEAVAKRARRDSGELNANADQGVDAGFRVPRAFPGMARTVALHSSAGRWPILYRVLWRLTHGEPRLLEVPTDADFMALEHLAKEVHKDAYRMRQ